MNINKLLIRYSSYLALLVMVSSCKKEVTQSAGRSDDGLVSFFGVSPQLVSEIGTTGVGYILTDRLDTATFKQTSPIITIPILSAIYKYQYPTNSYNYTLTQPWVQYLHLNSGQHTFALVDTGRYIRVKSNINLSPNAPQSIYYTDSLGYYRAFVLQDQLTSEAGKTRIRLLDFSPDAGNIFFTIDEKPASQTGFPAVMKYGQSTGFVSYANPKTDTLRINFYLAGDSTNVVARAFLQAGEGHSYTMALWGYNNPFVFYQDPKNGASKSINGGLSVLINQNN